MPNPILPAYLNVDDAVPDSWVDAISDDLNYQFGMGADIPSAAAIAVASRYHRLTGTTQVNTITAPVNAVSQDVRLYVVTGLTFGSAAAGSGGNIDLQGDQNAAVPAGTVVTFHYDRTAARWKETGRTSGGASAFAATTVAGLGAGTPGKIGFLRLPPVTYNAGGATALPAGTLTVGDTTELPTAGTMATPNGDIAYTGKTATTLTGCTGGTGTLAALAPLALKIGTPVGSFDTMALVYDSTIGKWVSPAMAYSVHIHNTGYGINSGTMVDMTTIDGSFRRPISGWRAKDYAGLKPQVRFIQHNSSSTPTAWQIQPSFTGYNFAEAAPSYTAADTAAASATINGAGTLISAWGNLPGGYTVKDIFAPSGQSKSLTAQILVWHMIYEVRWVG